MNRALGRRMFRRRRRRLLPWLLVKDPMGLADVLRQPSVRPKLVVLCGPSHAGKSSFADILSGTFTVVSSDAIRQRLGRRCVPHRREPAVWKAFDNAKRAAFRGGHDVVLDSCHLSRQARRHAAEMVPEGYDKRFVLFSPSLKQVMARRSVTRRLSPQEAERLWWVFKTNKPTRRELESLGFEQIYVMYTPNRQRVGARRLDFSGSNHRAFSPPCWVPKPPSPPQGWRNT